MIASMILTKRPASIGISGASALMTPTSPLPIVIIRGLSASNSPATASSLSIKNGATASIRATTTLPSMMTNRSRSGRNGSIIPRADVRIGAKASKIRPSVSPMMMKESPIFGPISTIFAKNSSKGPPNLSGSKALLSPSAIPARIGPRVAPRAARRGMKASSTPPIDSPNSAAYGAIS